MNEQVFVDQDTGSVGLTKRELFAAMAMQGHIFRNAILSMYNLKAYEEGRSEKLCELEGHERCAIHAVKWADALLAELSKEPNR